jgi:hypothetical protein
VTKDAMNGNLEVAKLLNDEYQGEIDLCHDEGTMDAAANFASWRCSNTCTSFSTRLIPEQSTLCYRTMNHDRSNTWLHGNGRLEVVQ